MSKIARQVGVHRKTIARWFSQDENVSDKVHSENVSDKVQSRNKLGLFNPVAPACKFGKVFLVTSAQNNTALAEDVWENLQAYAEYRGAEILVSRFIYRKEALGQEGQEKTHSKKNEKAVEWDARLTPYLADERRTLAPGLVWCGEMNTLPTAENPLSGLTNYTGQNSAIFPHPKLALESIATPVGKDAKILYTTGAITKPNYIQRKVGLKAEFHHVMGALIVEVDIDGTWWVRQLNSDGTGAFYDLDFYVSGGHASPYHGGLEGLQWGDIHEGFLEKLMREVCWGRGGILDQHKPRHQHVHDLLHFLSRSHHGLKDPHQMFELHVKELANVEEEVANSAAFLDMAYRPGTNTHVVCSNHDNALLRWLKEADYKTDPENAVYFLKLQLAVYESISRHDDRFNLMALAMKNAGLASPVNFLTENDSFTLCSDHGGIETACHGHLGPNGSYGSPEGYKRLGVRFNLGHTHSAGIRDGVYVAGVQGSLNQGYNKGFSSWSHSMIFTYPNAKRQIVQIKGPNLRHRL